MGNKGQFTIFVIVAIVVVVGVGLYFMTQSPLLNDAGSSAMVIDDFVKGCVEDVVNDAVIELGKNGGYFSLPNGSLNDNIAYFYVDKKDSFLSERKVEEEFASYVNSELLLCVKNFSDFPDFDVERGEMKTIVNIDDGVVSFDVTYPLSISKRKSVFELDNFYFEVPVRFRLVYDSAREIVESYKKYDALCISCMDELSVERDIYIEMFDARDSYVFLIIDKNSVIKAEALNFYFAVEK